MNAGLYVHVIILHIDDSNLNALQNELVFHQFSLMGLCWLHLMKSTNYDAMIVMDLNIFQLLSLKA